MFPAYEKLIGWPESPHRAAYHPPNAVWLPRACCSLHRDFDKREPGKYDSEIGNRDINAFCSLLFISLCLYLEQFLLQCFFKPFF